MDAHIDDDDDGWLPPAEFDGFTLGRQIGHGGMGRVFLAHEAALERSVAIKFITAAAPGRAAIERFFIEARALARIQHPNVVSIYRIGQVEGRPYTASEYVAGRSLASVQGPVAWSRALQIAADVARGLSEAHRRGVLHRDIKPSNVLEAPDGVVKLVDFGLAKLDESTSLPPSEPPVTSAPPPSRDPETRPAVPLPRREVPETPRQSPGVSQTLPAEQYDAPRSDPRTLTGAVLGTPLFLAPELWSGAKATPRSDVYSTGLLIYELCAGALPFANLVDRALVNHVREVDLPPLAGVRPEMPRAFAQIVDRAVRRDPEERFASAVELAEALDGVNVVFQSFRRMASGGEDDDATLVAASLARWSERADVVFTEVYDELFRRAPALRMLFPLEMEEQRAKLFGTVRLAVESLSKPERLLPVLEDLGRRHRDYGVVPKHLRLFGDALLLCLERADRTHWTPATATAWGRAYAAVAGAMEQGMLLGMSSRSA